MTASPPSFASFADGVALLGDADTEAHSPLEKLGAVTRSRG